MEYIYYITKKHNIYTLRVVFYDVNFHDLYCCTLSSNYDRAKLKAQHIVSNHSHQCLLVENTDIFYDDVLNNNENKNAA